MHVPSSSATGCSGQAEQCCLVPFFCPLRQERSPGGLPEETAVKLFSQMLNAVKHVHNRGICYGDVKPANFLLKSTEPGDDGSSIGLQVKLADFGCSQEYSDEDFLTQRTGTPLYTAPEVYLGRYSEAADLWGMGMILYRMLSGEFPFRRNLDSLSPYIMMLSVLNDELSFEGACWEGVSREAQDLVFHLLQRCVDRRSTVSAALQHPWLRMHGCHDGAMATDIDPLPASAKDKIQPL